MMLTMILATAMTCQAPAPKTGPKTDAELRAIMAEIRARTADPSVQARMRRERIARQTRVYELEQRYEAERPTREAAYRARREAAAKAQAAAQAKAEKDYKAMLPFMLEAQRQQVQRMSDIERNAALHRMAAAAEYEAQTNKQRADNFAWWLMQNRK